MTGKFEKFMKRRDGFGHPIQVNYKGETSYQTACGGFLTITVYITTMVIAFIQLKELSLMLDPDIMQYEIPLTKEEKGDIVPLQLREYGYTFGVATFIADMMTG